MMRGRVGRQLSQIVLLGDVVSPKKNTTIARTKVPDANSMNSNRNKEIVMQQRCSAKIPVCSCRFIKTQRYLAQAPDAKSMSMLVMSSRLKQPISLVHSISSIRGAIRTQNLHCRCSSVRYSDNQGWGVVLHCQCHVDILEHRQLLPSPF